MIGRHLWPVRLDLGEVRIERHVRGQVWRQPILEPQTKLTNRVARVIDPRIGIERAKPHTRNLGQNLEVPTLGQTRQPIELPKLRQLASDTPRYRRPRLCFGLSADHPDDLKSPLMHVARRARRIPETLERDPHFGRPPVLDNLAAGIKERIP